MNIRLAALLLLALISCAQERPFAERDPRYLLQPNDIVEIQYRYTPEFNQTAAVQPDGFVTLQLVGDIRFGGLSMEEARAALIEKAKTRLRDPEIALVLKQFQKPYFIVNGEVQNPGRFDFLGNTTAIEAIAIAGGFKQSAKRSEVVLFRRSNGNTQAILVDVKSMLKNRRLNEDAQLRPGDMVWIPQNTVSEVAKWVQAFNAGMFINPLPRF